MLRISHNVTAKAAHTALPVGISGTTPGPSPCRLHCAVLRRRIAHTLLEYAREMLRILETEAIRYLADILIPAENLLFGETYQFVAYVRLRRTPGHLLYKVSEIVW